ncbi:hypothetical protein G7078_02165 [Sphingomonas sinipercae]|uniref:Uncharacterized protein n=1 Tax=Sphingomonas sinipercae TaxID=2714944 RepID=A0A6G7ZLD3_9SPHN|nr:hypothetical protein [Sphingomonas sinipercae]QIL01706.1 hypothetical protein G7078_02165 [Sphingomonas sinipercae]
MEVRLNATPEIVDTFVAALGWSLEPVQWGDTLFLRREQSMERNAVGAMLIDMLEFAGLAGMRFHSWLHGSDLED